MAFREEKDSMGIVQVPESAYYGAQTQRAVDNFPVSGIRMPAAFIAALALIKKHAAMVNRDLGLLAPDLADAIARAADDVLSGQMADQFPVDVFQTGSGTSTNMNMNEVLAGRANEIMTGQRGSRHPVHPNDHVNLGQSSNDVIPAGIHLSALLQIQQQLMPALQKLQAALHNKASEFASVWKIGRTHLQDAVPIRLGDEFSGYAAQIELGIQRLKTASDQLSPLALGGTAVGNGVNTHAQFAERVCRALATATQLDIRETRHHFQAQSTQDSAVATSATLKTVAVSLVKIANDIRWLASGPRCGIGEINIPSLQPGSSIMPGKVNPVIPEMVIQAAYQVIGNDTAITLGGQSGVFELNVTLPMIAHNLLQSIALLKSSADLLTRNCVEQISANRERCAGYIEQSLALATALVPAIGYDRAADIAKRASIQGRTIREVAIEEKILPPDQIEKLLSLEAADKDK